MEELGMSSTHRSLLDQYRSQICRDLLTDRIVRSLMEKKVFDEDDWQEIKAEKSQEDKAMAALSLLKRKGPNAFTDFVEALDKIQPHLAKPFKDYINGYRQRVFKYPSTEPMECDETLPKQPVEADMDGNITPNQQMFELKSYTSEDSDSTLTPQNCSREPQESDDFTHINFSPQRSPLTPGVDGAEAVSLTTNANTMVHSHNAEEKEQEHSHKNETENCCAGKAADNLPDRPADLKIQQLDESKSVPNNNFGKQYNPNTRSDSQNKQVLENLKEPQFRKTDCGACPKLNNCTERTMRQCLSIEDNEFVVSPNNQNYLNELQDFSIRQAQALTNRLNLDIDIGKKPEKVDKMVGILVKSTSVNKIVEALETEEVNRRDVAKALKRMNSKPLKPGPKIDPSLPISKLKFSLRHKIVKELSLENHNATDWRLLADELGYSEYIELWRQKYDLPAEQLLLCWQVRSDSTVGTLHSLLHDLEMGAIADLL